MKRTMFKFVLLVLSLRCFNVAVADTPTCDYRDLRTLFVQLNSMSKENDNQIRNLKETIKVTNTTASTNLDETNRRIDDLNSTMDTIRKEIENINKILATFCNVHSICVVCGDKYIYFNETAPIGYVGESLILTCVVENMSGLSDIIIKKGTGRTEVAKLTTNYTIDGTKIIYADSRIVNNTGVLKINMTVKCGDDKDYYCTASGAGSETPSEDVLSVAVYWKASKPVLDPSSDMVENTPVIWGDGGFDTRCTGELGFHNATIYMQVEHSDGTVTIMPRNVVNSSYDVKMCSNKQTIKFDQRYQSSWNGSIIRCIVDTGKETYVDAEYVRVIPATYCDDVNVSATVTVTKPHPFDCRAFLTCTNTPKKIIPQRPNAQCSVDECYNVNDPSKCVPCGDKCRPDPLQDALPHMLCEDKTAKIGSSASVICFLYNIMVENVSTPSILITRQSSVWFNTKNVQPVTSSVSEATFNVSTGIQLIVKKANVELKFLNGPLCSDEGDFTFQYGGATSVQDTSKITVQSDPGTPELSKTPDNFYRGQEMTLTCSGSIGKPKSTLSLKRKSPTDGQFEVVQGVVIGNDIYDSATCAFNRTLSYSFVVSSSQENTTYKCETTGSNGTSYSSKNETVKIQNALVGFANDAETAEIGLRKQIQCVLINYDGQSRVNISRQTLAGKEDVCSVNNNTVVLSTADFNCTLHTDGNKTSVTVNMIVSCATEGTYYCESLGMKGSMQLSVTRNASKPVLKLPQDNAVIENVVIPQVDPVACTADVGYPANGKELKIQYKLNNSDVFVDFLIPTVVTDCTQNATVTTTWNTRLNLTFDGASFRCGIFENGSISYESPVKTLRVISNDCPSTQNDVYLPHPLNCHKYIWCYPSGIAVQSCAGTGCFNITAAATAAGGLCDDMSCGNATCTSG